MNHKETANIQNSSAVSGLSRFPHYYPTHFLRGTHISIDNNKTNSSKLVENLEAGDFRMLTEMQEPFNEFEMVVGCVREIKTQTFEKGIDILFEIEETFNKKNSKSEV